MESVLHTTSKLHLGQIGNYPLFIQVGIGNPILSNSNSSVIFLSFSQGVWINLFYGVLIKKTYFMEYFQTIYVLHVWIVAKLISLSISKYPLKLKQTQLRHYKTYYYDITISQESTMLKCSAVI